MKKFIGFLLLFITVISPIVWYQIYCHLEIAYPGIGLSCFVSCFLSMFLTGFLGAYLIDALHDN